MQNAVLRSILEHPVLWCIFLKRFHCTGTEMEESYFQYTYIS